MCISTKIITSSCKSVKALAASGDQGIEAAMEWLLEHNDDVEMEAETGTTVPESKTDPKVNEAEDKASAEAEVKSYKCLE